MQLDDVRRVARALSVRTLLHLPRLTRSDGTVSRRSVETELHRHAVRLREDQRSVGELIPRNRLETHVTFIRRF